MLRSSPAERRLECATNRGALSGMWISDVSRQQTDSEKWVLLTVQCSVNSIMASLLLPPFQAAYGGVSADHAQLPQRSGALPLVSPPVAAMQPTAPVAHAHLTPPSADPPMIQQDVARQVEPQATAGIARQISLRQPRISDVAAMEFWHIECKYRVTSSWSPWQASHTKSSTVSWDVQAATSLACMDSVFTHALTLVQVLQSMHR